MRCSICGSKQVSLVTNSSYSMKKGIVGAVVLGPVGAVAGINGKQSTNYHCMSCGQNSLSIMDRYIEKLIDEALENGDRETLDRFRRSWKNIEFPVNNPSARVTKTVEPRKPVERKHYKSLKEIAMVVKEDVAQSVIPYELSELMEKYDFDLGRNAIVPLMKEGSVREVFVDDKVYIVPAKSIDEIKEFKFIESAAFGVRQDIEDEGLVFDDVIRIAKKHGSISLIDLQTEYAEMHPELIWEDNPYSITRLVEGLVYELNYDSFIHYKDGIITIPSLMEREEYYREKAKNQSHDVKWGHDVLNAIKPHVDEKLSVDKIVDLVKNLSNREYEYSCDIDIYEYTNEYDTIQFYTELLYYKKEGILSNEIVGDTSYWILKDKNREKRELLQSQVEKLKYEIEELRMQYNTEEAVYREALVENNCVSYPDNTETIKKIDVNDERIRELEQILPSLKGLFKRKKREEAENEKQFLLDENDSLRRQLQEQKEAFERKRSELAIPKNAIKDKIDNMNNQIVSKESEIRSLRSF